MSWQGNIRSHVHLQVTIFLYQPAILKDTWKMQFSNFIKLKNMIQSWLPQIFLETSIYIHLKMETEEFVACFWPMFWYKCCQFPVISRSFHRSGRKHYIRPVKMFERKPSMLYTMIVKSLVHCWDNFEQNAKMLAQCWHKNVGRHLLQLKNDLAGGRNYNKYVFCVECFSWQQQVWGV